MMNEMVLMDAIDELEKISDGTVKSLEDIQKAVGTSCRELEMFIDWVYNYGLEYGRVQPK